MWILAQLKHIVLGESLDMDAIVAGRTIHLR